MYKDKKVICIIPARSGSKGIKNKNIFPFLNNPLIYYTIEFAKKILPVERILVSSDSEDILDYSKSLGIAYDYIRPASLSGDFISDKEVIRDVVLDFTNKKKENFDCVLYLQPTSPVRKIGDFRKMFEQFFSQNLDSLWTISEIDSKFHPLKQIVINESNFIELYDKDGLEIIARQQLTKSYCRNGVAYLFKPDFILSDNKLLSKKTGYHLINYPVVSIDTLEDLKKAEFSYRDVNDE